MQTMKHIVPSEKGKPFRLVKYFTFTSLVVIFLGTIVLSVMNVRWARSLQLSKSEEYALGGMTTEDYLAMFDTRLDSAIEVISVAMSIEAQALDLYQRAAETADISQTKRLLMDIAGEERSHLNQLGDLMDRI